MKNGNKVDFKRIDELRQNKTLKKQYAFLLFYCHNNKRNDNLSSFEAACEFVKKNYPHEPPNENNIALYIANTWPGDINVFEYFMVLKEAEAQGEFYPNKAQLITHVMNILDMLAEEVRERDYSIMSKNYNKIQSLRGNVLDTSKLLHDLMGWDF